MENHQKIRRKIIEIQKLVKLFRQENHTLSDKKKMQESLINNWSKSDHMKKILGILDKLVLPDQFEQETPGLSNELQQKILQQMSYTCKETKDECTSLNDQLQQIDQFINQLEHEIIELYDLLENDSEHNKSAAE